jgi:hypothetical protein
VIRRVALAVCAAILLAGCTDADWDKAMATVEFGDPAAPDPSAVPPSQPNPAQAAVDASSQEAWCRLVAQSTMSEAAADGFDAQTQKLRGEAQYRQCLQPTDTMR